MALFYKILLAFILLTSVSMHSQSKQDYLNKNKSDLTKNFKFNDKNVFITGFGAYHGSAKTEDAEILLLQSIIKNEGLDYYFFETDISLAHYFSEYLTTGDETLLNDLIVNYGRRVPQERTVEVAQKWKKLKAINDKLPKNKKITVLGPDPIVTYKYTYRHLLSLLKNPSDFKTAAALQATIKTDTTDFSPDYNSYSKRQLKDFVAEYDANSEAYNSAIKDTVIFNHLLHCIKVSFGDYSREREIYNNYLSLSKIYNLHDKRQFIRYGFAHQLKIKEGNRASFISMLIENGIYNKNQIVTVMGYLTKSEVIWDDFYDDNGNYTHSVNSGDEGIGDSDTEYFEGITELKKQRISDLTIFKMNGTNSPYAMPKCIDMIKISNDAPIDYGSALTTDYIDYALLISNSAASKSIFTIIKSK